MSEGFRCASSRAGGHPTKGGVVRGPLSAHMGEECVAAEAAMKEAPTCDAEWPVHGLVFKPLPHCAEAFAQQRGGGHHASGGLPLHWGRAGLSGLGQV